MVWWVCGAGIAKVPIIWMPLISMLAFWPPMASTCFSSTANPSGRSALACAADAGIESFAFKRILDIGYGQLGQLEMLARCGAEVDGVEVDPVVHLLYASTRLTDTVVAEDGIDLHVAGESEGEALLNALALLMNHCRAGLNRSGAMNTASFEVFGNAP